MLKGVLLELMSQLQLSLGIGKVDRNVLKNSLGLSDVMYNKEDINEDSFRLELLRSSLCDCRRSIMEHSWKPEFLNILYRILLTKSFLNIM